MALESKKAENEDFNIGYGKEVRIIDLAKILFKLCNAKKPFRVKFVAGFTYDIKRRVPSSQKARELLGWKSEKRLEEELPVIINWVKKINYRKSF